MLIALAGIIFEVGPDAHLTHSEREFLDTVGCVADRADMNVDVRRSGQRICGAAISQEPYSITEDGPRVSIEHVNFSAEIDFSTYRIRLHRWIEASMPLQFTLRVSLALLLPLRSALPLHASGLLASGHAVVAFGPSGAGKSTLTAASELPVLSDELIAVFTGPPVTARATGFWGSYEVRQQPKGEFPAAALLELEKGGRFSLERLGSSEAVRALTTALLVPALPSYWGRTLPLLAHLVERVPVFRLTWSLLQPIRDPLVDTLIQSGVLPDSGGS